MKVFIDQLGNGISLKDTPKRIISIVPSQTELLYDLGLDEEVIGITKFCIHPNQWFKSKIRIGGTKKLDIEKIISLKPDLIIGNKEENEKSQIEELMKHFPVWMSDIKNLDEALAMISSLGEITNKKEAALMIINNINSNFKQLQNKTTNLQPIASVYFIWNEPMMCAGKGTFIDDMLSHCGLKNIFEGKDGRYPEISDEKLKQLNPSIVFLSSEPFPFNKKHVLEFQQRLPHSTIKLVDGEMFSWYGSRLQITPKYFESIINSIRP